MTARIVRSRRFSLQVRRLHLGHAQATAQTHAGQQPDGEQGTGAAQRMAAGVVVQSMADAAPVLADVAEAML